MTTTHPTLAASIDGFLRACAGKNCSPQTIRAYRTDVGQFVTWLQRPVAAQEMTLCKSVSARADRSDSECLPSSARIEALDLKGKPGSSHSQTNWVE